ncbi:MAG: hypothetical protein AAF772_19730, partial [Acidobacteriota bacterium]
MVAASLFLLTAQVAAARPAVDLRPPVDALTVPSTESTVRGERLAGDPVGDTFGEGAVQLDVTQLGATVVGNNLEVTLTFAGPVSAPDSGQPNALDGFIDLDLDQSGATGVVPWTDFLRGDDGQTGMGNEAYVDLRTFEGGAVEVFDDVADQRIGFANLVIDGANATVRIPLALLGGDVDVDVAAIVGTLAESTDAAPNQGAVASSPSQEVFLQDNRFRVDVTWADFDGNRGTGKLVTQSHDSAVFYFFAPDNWELMIKVLDACDSPFNSFWVFTAATTNVEYTITVTDTE